MRTRLSPCGKIAIPRKVCQIIGLEPGDLVSVEIADNDSLLIRRVEEYDRAYNLILSDTFDAWVAETQREAFSDL
jgi:antitoxin component of MazEF toxin-antitoxin module